MHRTRVAAICGTVVVSMLAVGCWRTDQLPTAPSISELNGSGWEQLRDDALAAQKQARDAFYEGIPSSHDVKPVPKGLPTLSDLPPVPEGTNSANVRLDTIAVEDLGVVDSIVDTMGPRELIESLARIAALTGDTTSFIETLKAMGLYEKYLQVIEEYNLAYHAKNLASRPKEKKLSQDAIITAPARAGDILLCYGGGGSSASQISTFIPGKWKHAGQYDGVNKSRGWDNCIYGAGTDGTGDAKDAKVRYERASTWTKETEVSIYRVKNSTEAQGQAGVNYIKNNFDGREFNFFSNVGFSAGCAILLSNTSTGTTLLNILFPGVGELAASLAKAGLKPVARSADDKWYCSKTVWRGWQNQGRDIETHSNWVRKWKWGWSKTFIPYPIQVYYTEPDDYATPQDLADDDDVQWITGDPK